jgi:hypothetical protein
LGGVGRGNNWLGNVNRTRWFIRLRATRANKTDDDTQHNSQHDSGAHDSILLGLPRMVAATLDSLQVNRLHVTARAVAIDGFFRSPGADLTQRRRLGIVALT